MKICVFFLIQLLPFIVKVGDWALRWTEGNAAVQIFFVMLLFPVCMNAIQYYIIDTFIKKPSHELLEEDGDQGDDSDNDPDHRHALLAGLEDDGTLVSEDDATERGPAKSLDSPSRTKEALSKFNAADYPPTARGESSSASTASTGSSSSSHGEYDLMSSSTKLTVQPKTP